MYLCSWLLNELSIVRTLCTYDIYISSNNYVITFQSFNGNFSLFIIICIKSLAIRLQVQGINGNPRYKGY